MILLWESMLPVNKAHGKKQRRFFCHFKQLCRVWASGSLAMVIWDNLYWAAGPSAWPHEVVSYVPGVEPPPPRRPAPAVLKTPARHVESYRPAHSATGTPFRLPFQILYPFPANLLNEDQDESYRRLGRNHNSFPWNSKSGLKTFHGWHPHWIHISVDHWYNLNSREKLLGRYFS